MNELYIEQCSGLVRKTAELCNVFCKDCKVEGFVDEAEFRKGDLLFQKEAITAPKLCYTTRKSILYKYNKHLAEVQDCLARCYAMIGEFKIAVEYLRDGVHTLGFMYRENRIEFANEPQKISESLIGAQKWTEAVAANEKARNIFKKRYGKTHETVKELTSSRNELMQAVKNAVAFFNSMSDVGSNGRTNHCISLFITVKKGTLKQISKSVL